MLCLLCCVRRDERARDVRNSITACRWSRGRPRAARSPRRPSIINVEGKSNRCDAARPETPLTPKRHVLVYQIPDSAGRERPGEFTQPDPASSSSIHLFLHPTLRPRKFYTNKSRKFPSRLTVSAMRRQVGEPPSFLPSVLYSPYFA